MASRVPRRPMTEVKDELSAARVHRERQRELNRRRLEKQKFNEDKRAYNRLIKRYTAQRDWFMVERLFNDLYRLFQEEDAQS